MQPLEYGPPISLEEAKHVVAAAQAEATQNGWAMVIAVLDSGGHLVVLHKMDHAQFGSISIAQKKALTAVNFKRPTKVFEDAVAAGGIGLRMLSAEEVCALEGGLPLVREGKLVGAIGVSGAQSAQDGVVALAGARVVSARAGSKA
jgi:glc operon protein GlcG